MTRALTIAAIVGALLVRLFVVDMSEQARATYCVAIAVFLLALTLTPKADR